MLRTTIFYPNFPPKLFAITELAEFWTPIKFGLKTLLGTQPADWAASRMASFSCCTWWSIGLVPSYRGRSFSLACRQSKYLALIPGASHLMVTSGTCAVWSLPEEVTFGGQIETLIIHVTGRWSLTFPGSCGVFWQYVTFFRSWALLATWSIHVNILDLKEKYVYLVVCLNRKSTTARSFETRKSYIIAICLLKPGNLCQFFDKSWHRGSCTL